MSGKRAILPMFFSDHATAENSLRLRISALSEEIALAERKQLAIREAIESRKNARARLEAQLAIIASPVRSAP